MSRLLLFATIISCSFAGTVDANNSSSLNPDFLRCEYKVDPLGIDVTTTRLSWVVESSERAQKQTAYQILVSDNAETLAGSVGTLWDSGKVNSDETTQISYAGKPFTSRMRCYWKVRVWDQDGTVSAWSKPAYWSMGLLNKADWQAKWISYDTAALNEDETLLLPPSPYLRNNFVATSPLKRATVYVTALGLYKLSINGKRVGADYFTPGWTDYNKRLYYQTYDVTDLVNEGDNAIGAVLSNGWYAGYVGFALLQNRGNKGRGLYGETPALFLQLELEYEDGHRETIISNDDWRASTGPVRKSDIQMGETYDARLEIQGWDKFGFAAESWKPVSIMGEPQAKIEAYPGVPVQVTGEIAAKEITEPKRGVYIFNMGQNFAGWVRLKVTGEAGTTIVLRFGEMLHPDGRLMTENLRKARATDTYMLRGDPNGETWEPEFTYHGFQYVEVTGYPGKPELDAITGVAVNSTTPTTGAFECSSELVNKLYSNITWTQRANFIEVPTDCPQRDERLGWTGDAQVYVQSAAYNCDIAAFYTKWLVDLEDARRDYGAYPDFAPLPYLQEEPSPAWMDAGIICPYTIYKMYGDTRVIERHYAAMARFIDYLTRTSDDGLRKPQHHCWGDWLSIGGKTSEPFIATAYYAYDLKLMAEMAAAINKSEDTKKYTELFNKAKAAFNKRFVEENGRIDLDSQTAYAMALYMDLLPQNQRTTAAERLVKLIEENNGNLGTGFLGMKPLLPALTMEGYSDVAYSLLTNTDFPSWGYSIVNGATTIWERWNSYTIENGFGDAGMNSFSHYAFGAVCEWMFSDMAGIKTDGPGFKQITIRPQMGGADITWTKASYNSIRGPIATIWRIGDSRTTLEVTIPANTTAKIYLPTTQIEKITESGKSLKETEGVLSTAIERGKSILTIGSGEYSFEIANSK